MIFRSHRQKADLKASFNRPDRPFFAVGACHVLAHAFLETCNSNHWQAELIWPISNHPGYHVFATNGSTTFDYHGFVDYDRFVSHYFSKMNRFFPNWKGEVSRLSTSPIGAEFCEQYTHRQPHQYYADPLPRAFAFVEKYVDQLRLMQKVK